MFPRCFVFASSISGEAFSDCFVRIMVCSLGITPDGKRYICQRVGCGKKVLKNWRNVCTGRWISLEAAYASMF